MEIRDVIHGSIPLENSELPIIDSRYFQRLRQIKQLGFAEYSYPSATHNRYIHSLGAMATASRAFDSILNQTRLAPADQIKLSRFRPVVRLAALLHDVGHGPLSHTTEFAMPDVRELKLPAQWYPVAPRTRARKATHEDYTLKMILDSGLSPLLQKAAHATGFQPIHIACLIDADLPSPDDFFIERIDGEPVNFRPLLQQLISSELDADRMDYLRRDSFHAGVSYGQFDFDWIVGNLTLHLNESRSKTGSSSGPKTQAHLALHHRALYSFEDFLISRFHMFLMVYFHYKSVIFDRMLAEYFESNDCSYALPADVEKYCESNDAELSSHLAASSNSWAKRITDKRTYRMLIELHSGIPATKTAESEQQRLLTKIQKDLKSQGIHFLISTSTGELSKYFNRPVDPIFVRYDNHYNAVSAIPLEQCTDLFKRYSEKRSITRLYVPPERYSECRFQGRTSPLRYQDETPGALL